MHENILELMNDALFQDRRGRMVDDTTEPETEGRETNLLAPTRLLSATARAT